MGFDADTAGSWGEWSKHVLKELQRLNAGQDTIRDEILQLKSNISKLSIVENRLEEIGKWKGSMAEVASPTQMKELVKKVEGLEAFKVKAIAIFTFAQIIVGAILGLIKLL
jgi:hypothetical protein